MSIKDDIRTLVSSPELIHATEDDTGTFGRLAPAPLQSDGGLPRAGSTDYFLIAVKKLFAKALAPGDVSVTRNNDIDNYDVEGEIVVRTTTPDGLQLTARKRIRRRTLRWVRLWPYVTIVLALAIAILIVWQGGQILRLLSGLAG